MGSYQERGWRQQKIKEDAEDHSSSQNYEIFAASIQGRKGQTYDRFKSSLGTEIHACTMKQLILLHSVSASVSDNKIWNKIDADDLEECVSNGKCQCLPSDLRVHKDNRKKLDLNGKDNVVLTGQGLRMTFWLLMVRFNLNGPLKNAKNNRRSRKISMNMVPSVSWGYAQEMQGSHVVLVKTADHYMIIEFDRIVTE
ncbi:hypothetical protein Tco_1379252 [Tanacetum coccineum]